MFSLLQQHLGPKGRQGSIEDSDNRSERDLYRNKYGMSARTPTPLEDENDQNKGSRAATPDSRKDTTEEDQKDAQTNVQNTEAEKEDSRPNKVDDAVESHPELTQKHASQTDNNETRPSKSPTPRKKTVNLKAREDRAENGKSDKRSPETPRKKLGNAKTKEEPDKYGKSSPATPRKKLGNAKTREEPDKNRKSDQLNTKAKANTLRKGDIGNASPKPDRKHKSHNDEDNKNTKPKSVSSQNSYSKKKEGPEKASQHNHQEQKQEQATESSSMNDDYSPDRTPGANENHTPQTGDYKVKTSLSSQVTAADNGKPRAEAEQKENVEANGNLSNRDNTDDEMSQNMQEYSTDEDQRDASSSSSSRSSSRKEQADRSRQNSVSPGASNQEEKTYGATARHNDEVQSKKPSLSRKNSKGLSVKFETADNNDDEADKRKLKSPVLRREDSPEERENSDSEDQNTAVNAKQMIKQSQPVRKYSGTRRNNSTPPNSQLTSQVKKDEDITGKDKHSDGLENRESKSNSKSSRTVTFSPNHSERSHSSSQLDHEGSYEDEGEKSEVNQSSSLEMQDEHENKSDLESSDSDESELTQESDDENTDIDGADSADIDGPDEEPPSADKIKLLLLFRLGRKVIADTLLTFISKKRIGKIMSENNFRTKFKVLEKQGFITNEQFKMLYPHKKRGGIDKFDTALLFVLIRTLCTNPYIIDAPKVPVSREFLKQEYFEEDDQSLEANIARLKQLRAQAIGPQTFDVVVNILENFSLIPGTKDDVTKEIEEIKNNDILQSKEESEEVKMKADIRKIRKDLNTFSCFDFASLENAVSLIEEIQKEQVSVD